MDCAHGIPEGHVCPPCEGVVPSDPGAWPEEPARQCPGCKKERHDVRRRVPLGGRELCAPCFREVRP